MSTSENCRIKGGCFLGLPQEGKREKILKQEAIKSRPWEEIEEVPRERR